MKILYKNTELNTLYQLHHYRILSKKLSFLNYKQKPEYKTARHKNKKD
jgi:hypothetical protein